MIEDVDYTASGYIQAIAPDGTVISRHRQEREAQQACFQHAKDNEDLLGDGVHDYILRSPDVRMSIRLLSVGGNPTNEDTTPPDPPAGVFNNSVTSTGFTTNWTNGPESDLQEHRVYRSSTGPGSGFSLVDTVTVPTASYSHTGLTAETQYWVYVTALDSSGNESVASSVVNSTTSAATSDTNAQRIDALLAGRSPHFSYLTPADPVTTREVTVTSATQFNSEALTGSVKININSSFSGDIQIRGNDVDVVMSNSATITGNLDLGTGSVYRTTRVRWTGGNVSGALTGRQFDHVLFDDFYLNSGSSPNNLTGNSNRFSNLTFLNSTIENNPGARAGSAWAIFIQQNPTGGIDHDGLIFGNTKVISSALHAWRIQSTDNVLIFDSVGNPDGGSLSGLRFHYECDNIWIADTWVRGSFHVNEVNTSDLGPSFTNGRFDNFDRYAPDEVSGLYAFSAPLTNANDGTILNSTLFNTSGTGTVGFAGMTNGGGNTNSTWDETTVPDYSTVGAVR